MKFMMVAVQVVIAMFCLYHESSVIAAASSLEVTQKEPQVTILLERMYVDGEVSEEIFTEKVANLEQFLQQYKEWQLVDRDDTQIVLQKRWMIFHHYLKRVGILVFPMRGYCKFLTVYQKVIMRFIHSSKLI